MKNQNISALIGSILIFIATFLSSATNGIFGQSALQAGGIWYLLPLAGIAAIVFSSLALAKKFELTLPAYIIGGISLALGLMLAIQASNQLEVFAAMSSDMGKGFNSSFFTGEKQDLSNVAKSSFGDGFYANTIGSIMLILAGFRSRTKKEEAKSE